MGLTVEKKVDEDSDPRSISYVPYTSHSGPMPLSERCSNLVQFWNHELVTHASGAGLYRK